VLVVAANQAFAMDQSATHDGHVVEADTPDQLFCQ
jgi:hypothetical protein